MHIFEFDLFALFLNIYLFKEIMQLLFKIQKVEMKLPGRYFNTLTVI